jgi:thiamine-phosphate pyrophosphorylase
VRAPLDRLHAVTDEVVAGRPDLPARAAALAAGAANRLTLHARGPALSGRDLYALARRFADLCPRAHVFVNDRVDVALAARAHGVQLRASSLAPSEARSVGPEWWIGRSVHDLDEARTAQAAGADYLVVGPVFTTATHPDRPPLDTRTLEQIAGLGLPVIAIGGVTPERIAPLRAAGVYGVAAIRSLWSAADPVAAARDMMKELER